MKAMCMISSLFTRNSSVQENVRGLHDHLHAVIPNSHRKCPPISAYDGGIESRVDDDAQRLVESGQCISWAIF
eukprot:5349993-Pyramimonas_sp.AAC.1